MKSIRYIILSGIIIVLFQCAAAQTLEIDSLETKLESANSIEKCEILRRLLDIYQFSDIERSLEYVDQAIALAPILSDSIAWARLIRNKAQFLSISGQYHLIKPLVDPWLSPCERASPRDFGHMLDLLAVSETMQGDYANALEKLTKAISLPPVHRGIGLKPLYGNLGLVYYKLRDYRKAAFFFSKRLTIEMFVLENDDLPSGYMNLGLALGNLKYFETAENLINVGLQYSSFGDTREFIEGYFALGLVLFDKKEFVRSESYLTKALELANSNRDSRFIAECCAYLAAIRIRHSDFANARVLLNRCQEICDEFGYKEVALRCYRIMIDLHAATGEFFKMAKYQNAALKINASLHNNELANNLSAVEHELRGMQRNIVLKGQQEQIRVQNRIAQVHNVTHYALATFCALLVILITTLYVDSKTRKKIYRKLRALQEKRERERDKVYSSKLIQSKNCLPEAAKRLRNFLNEISDAGIDISGTNINLALQEMQKLTTKLFGL